MKKFEKFNRYQIPKAEMIAINGGKWCQQYDCTCGTEGFNGYGGLDQYRADVRQSCSPGNPVSCQFSQLPSELC